MLRDLGRDDPQLDAAIAVINSVDPDILLLTDVDYDLDGLALAALASRLDRTGLTETFALQPNAGLPTGQDIDRNGRLGEARDAQGYGRFAGQGGIAILSRWPIAPDQVTDFSRLLWADLPEATLPKREGEDFWPAAVTQVQRLSNTGHWMVPITTPQGALTLLAYSATPPVFDGPEDRNGLRNRDELYLWRHVLDGRMGPAPLNPVLLGNTNLDPADGDGFRAAMRLMLDDPRLQDPRPASAGAALLRDPTQTGDPALDTANWPEDDGPGNLRVSYILPATAFEVTGAGVFWPAPDDPQAALLGQDGLDAGPHHLVWVDVTWQPR